MDRDRIVDPGTRTVHGEDGALILESSVEPFGDPDADQDGLNDEWEDRVLDRLQPFVAFDPLERLFEDPQRVLGAVGRVAPAWDESGHVRVYIMLGYSRDYGICGVSAHHGDSERVVIDLLPRPAPPRSWEVSIFYTAAHELDDGDASRIHPPYEMEVTHDERAGGPRWVVFSSRNKHASYASSWECEHAASATCRREVCGFGPMALFPIVNAGEETAPRSDGLGEIGFLGESAWGWQPFCGGLGPGAACASPVRDKLTLDPFGWAPW